MFSGPFRLGILAGSVGSVPGPSSAVGGRPGLGPPAGMASGARMRLPRLLWRGLGRALSGGRGWAWGGGSGCGGFGLWPLIEVCRLHRRSGLRMPSHVLHSAGLGITDDLECERCLSERYP